MKQIYRRMGTASVHQVQIRLLSHSIRAAYRIYVPARALLPLRLGDKRRQKRRASLGVRHGKSMAINQRPSLSLLDRLPCTLLSWAGAA